MSPSGSCDLLSALRAVFESVALVNTEQGAVCVQPTIYLLANHSVQNILKSYKCHANRITTYIIRTGCGNFRIFVLYSIIRKLKLRNFPCTIGSTSLC